MPARPSCVVLLPLLAAALLPGTAAAKPHAGGGSGDTSVERRVDRGSGASSQTRQSIGVAFVADGPLHPEQGSYGVAAEYRLRFDDMWGFLGGAQLRFRDGAILVEPFAAGEATVLETRHFSIAGGGGVAVPVTVLPDRTDVAAALRASAMVRWLWPLTDWVTPYAEAVAMVGPTLTPETPYDVHASLQLWVGAALNF